MLFVIRQSQKKDGREKRTQRIKREEKKRIDGEKEEWTNWGWKSELHITYIRMLQISVFPLAIVVFDVHKWQFNRNPSDAMRIAFHIKHIDIPSISYIFVWKMFFWFLFGKWLLYRKLRWYFFLLSNGFTSHFCFSLSLTLLLTVIE